MELTVSGFLALPQLEGLRLLAGGRGGERVITRTNVIDNPDSLDWFMPGEFLLSSGYILQERPALQRTLIASLAEINCAGLCIKLGRYLDTVPRTMVEAANRLDFPLIELPFGYSLSTAAAAIHAHIFSQNDRQTEKTLEIHREIMRTALSSGQMFGLAETLTRLVGNPVLVTDSHWNLLCCVDRPDNPLPLERFASTTPKKPPFPASFLAALPQDLGNYRKAITRVLPLENGHQVRCRILPISAHGMIYGYLIVWESVRDLAELDFAALEQVAVMAALERIRAKEVEQTKLRVRKDFLDDLLSGNVASQNAIRSLAAVHGLAFDSHYRCLIVRSHTAEVLVHERDLLPMKAAADALTMERVSAAALHAAAEAGISLVPVARGIQLVLLVNLGQTPAEDTRALRRMAQAMAGALSPAEGPSSIQIVAGSPVPTLSDVSKSLENAQTGIHMARTTGLRDPVIFMDDYAAYQLLSEHVDRDVLARFCQTSIGPLLEFDRQGGAQLTETLDQYFRHNSSISEAAKAMYIHRNTYIYRLEKIKALLGTDLKKSRKLLELQLALLARSILQE